MQSKTKTKTNKLTKNQRRRIIYDMFKLMLEDGDTADYLVYLYNYDIDALKFIIASGVKDRYLKEIALRLYYYNCDLNDLYKAYAEAQELYLRDGVEV